MITDLDRQIVNAINGRGDDDDFIEIVKQGGSDSFEFKVHEDEGIITVFLNVELYAERMGEIMNGLLAARGSEYNLNVLI